MTILNATEGEEVFFLEEGGEGRREEEEGREGWERWRGEEEGRGRRRGFGGGSRSWGV